MKILISNDDGYSALGIELLAKALAPLGEITVVAPEANRSGASNSLTLDRPLTLRQASNGFYYVNGTPTDCVHLAVTGMLEEQPDIVVSGINHGANMGDDTIYSGTVAAATEGYLLGVPSVAVSVISHHPKHLETGAKIAYDVVKKIIEQNMLKRALLLNVNVPDIPLDEIKGMMLTRLGRRHKAEPVIKSKNPRGESIFWVGPAGKAQDAGEGTDFYAVEHQYVSITPLQIDLTHFEQLEQLRQNFIL